MCRRRPVREARQGEQTGDGGHRKKKSGQQKVAKGIVAIRRAASGNAKVSSLGETEKKKLISQ